MVRKAYELTKALSLYSNLSSRDLFSSKPDEHGKDLPPCVRVTSATSPKKCLLLALSILKVRIMRSSGGQLWLPVQVPAHIGSCLP